jgi:hypothetical protein
MSEMADPVPENISGEKTVAYSHEIHHSINWGYVVIGVAVIAALLWLRSADLGSDDDRPHSPG